jgi:alkanesulfonate monooxygenase SsuD/methylene tetrahydromethanopterin reductase-like flavin-dependent oxidoreductase (luciferase family)
VWSTTGNRTNARVLGEKGYVMATLGSGYATKPLYDAYRAAYASKWKRPAGADRVAYLGLVAVADDEAEARRRGELVAGYLRSSAIVHVPFRNPPGYLSVEDNARILRGESAPRSFTRDGRPINMHHGSVQDLIDAGILFCGTPDQVYRQLVDFCDYCGGMGNLLMMGQAGYLNHEDTVSNLTLFAKEVMPRLKAYKQPEPQTAAA